MLQAKNNLGAKCKGLAFRMEQRLIEGDILSSNIFFESGHVSQSIDEALTASESRGSAPGDVLLWDEMGREGRNPAGLAGKSQTPGGGPLGIWW